MTNISFWTPIQFINPEPDWTESLLESVDDYFYLGGSKATVLNNNFVMLPGKETTWLATALKVISYFTLIIPVLMLLAKMIVRETVPEEYRLDEALSARMPTDPALCDFYIKKGVFLNFAKPMVVDIDTLGLNLDQNLTIDPANYAAHRAPMIPVGRTMRQAVSEVVAMVNLQIRDNHRDQRNNPLEKNRTLELFTAMPWEQQGSNLGFYQQYGPSGLFKNEDSYLIEILKALKSQGHIHSTSGYQRLAGYTIKA